MAALDFADGRTPCAATLFLIFRTLDIAAYESALGRWAEGILQGCGDTIRAIDGKTLRGSKKQGASGTHLLSVVSQALGLTVQQEAVNDKTNKIGAMLSLVRGLVLDGRIFTMDALLTQREIAAQIVAGNGDYVQVAKDNQLRLKQDIEAVLASPPSVGAPLRTAATCAQRHGRREQRPITVRDLDPGDSDWPGAAQVFRLERDIIRLKTGEIRHEAICGVTSCPRARASARRLLTITRRHWVIENRSHYVRDVTFDEDRSQVRTGAIPQSLAALRNTAIALMRLAHVDNIAAACRRHAAQPAEALALMGVVVRTK